MTVPYSSQLTLSAPQLPLDTRLKPVLGAFVLTPIIWWNPQALIIPLIVYCIAYGCIYI